MAMIYGMSLSNLSPQDSGSKQKRRKFVKTRDGAWFQGNSKTYELTETDSEEGLHKFK